MQACLRFDSDWFYCSLSKVGIKSQELRVRCQSKVHMGRKNRQGSNGDVGEVIYDDGPGRMG